MVSKKLYAWYFFIVCPLFFLFILEGYEHTMGFRECDHMPLHKLDLSVGYLLH